MLVSLTLLACALYLVPLAALVAVLRGALDDALDLASAIGVVFCSDVLATLVLTNVLRVDAAAFVRTALLLAVTLVIAVRRVRRGEPVLRAWGPLSRGDLAALGLGAAAAFALSLYASSHYSIWDREWHVPFAASLRAQRMPFFNVYEPHKPLRYHFVGDVFAVTLQSLSFAAMSASRSLSLAHDLQSGVAGGIVALLLRALCAWPPVAAAASGLVPLLAGPMAFPASRLGRLGPFEGDSDFSNFSLSFRPHCMVAGVVLLGFMANVARLARDRLAQRAFDWTRPALRVVRMALLSISDEISTVLVGLRLALFWRPWPTLLGARRWQGAAVVVSLALAALAANYFLGGTVGPGGPIEKVRWLAPRLPRFAAPGLPLGRDLESWRVLFTDEGSLIIPALVAAGLLAANANVRKVLFPVLFAMAPAAGGLVLFLCFEANGRTYEGHRFVTAGRFLIPVAALLCAGQVRRASLPPLAAVALSVLLLVPVAAGVASSLGFIIYKLPHKGVTAVDGQYQTNCRDEFGARLGEPIVPTYVDQPIWYRYAGCHPIYAAGHDGSPGVVLAGPPKLGPEGYAKMNRETFPPGEAARVACATDPALETPLCTKAEAIGQCEGAGTRARACSIPVPLRPLLAVP